MFLILQVAIHKKHTLSSRVHTKERNCLVNEDSTQSADTIPGVELHMLWTPVNQIHEYGLS